MKIKCPICDEVYPNLSHGEMKVDYDEGIVVIEFGCVCGHNFEKAFEIPRGE